MPVEGGSKPFEKAAGLDDDRDPGDNDRSGDYDYSLLTARRDFHVVEKAQTLVAVVFDTKLISLLKKIERLQ